MDQPLPAALRSQRRAPGRLPIVLFAWAVMALTILPSDACAQGSLLNGVEVPLPTAFGEPSSATVSESYGVVADRIMIAAPPGRRAIHPRLSLAFSSLGGGGLAGAGWGMAMGSIESWQGDGDPSTLATIEGTPNDRFSFSLGGAGGELHDENGDGIYRAKIENVYRPFRRNGDGWLTHDGQGNAYYFGSRSDSRLDGEIWLLDLLEDPSGNTMTFAYGRECEVFDDPSCDGDNQTIYPKTVHYTGYAPNDTLGDNVIEFVYERRPDRRTAYRGGARISNNLRLKKIVVRAQGNLVRRYELSYSRYNNGPSLLSRVTLVGSDGISEVVLREITYTERSPAWQTQASPLLLSGPSLADADGKQTGVQFIDVDGDGFADVVDNGSAVYIGDGSGSFPTADAAWTAALQAIESATIGEDGVDTGVRFMDVDGDAMPDIVSARLVGGNPVSNVYLNNGSSWQRSAAWSDQLQSISGMSLALADTQAQTNCRAPLCSDFAAPAPSGCSPPYCTGCTVEAEQNEECSPADPEDCVPLAEDEEPLPICVPSNPGDFSVEVSEPFSFIGKDGEYPGVEMGDINGDGRMDIIWSLVFDQSAALGQTPRMVRAVLLNGGRDHPGWHPSNSLANALANVLTDNANGDGSAAAFVVEYELQGYSLVDVNGDGHADIIRSVEGKEAAYLFTGQGWEKSDSYTATMSALGIYGLKESLEGTGLVPTDFNEDGLVDYLQASPSQVRALRNDGAGWVLDPTMGTLFASAGVHFIDEDGASTGVSFADLNADGQMDLVAAKEAGPREFRLAESQRSNLLASAIGPLGEETIVTWAISTEFDNRTATGIQGLPIAMAVPRSLARDDGRGNVMQDTFSYEGGLFEDGGLRGFAKTTRTPNIGLRVETHFYQDEDRAGQPNVIRTYDSAGKLRTWSETETIRHSVEQGVTQVLVGTTDSAQYEEDGITLTTSSHIEREYDEFMQLIRKVEDPEIETPNDEVILTYDWHQKTEDGFWALLSRIEQRDSADEIVSEAINEYDNLGRPLRMRERISENDYTEVLMTFDAWGNMVETVDRAAATVEFLYDTTGTFRVQATDDLGHIRRTEYDPRFGLIVLDVDASGNQTTTEYDAFGRKIKATSPGDESSPHGTVSWTYSNLGDPNNQSFKERRTETAGTSELFETEYFYDAFGRIYETRQEGSHGRPVVIAREFGGDGLPGTTTSAFYEGDPDPTSTMIRDDMGRPSLLQDPLGQQLSITYNGRESTTIDARGQITRLISHPSGKPRRVTSQLDGQDQTTNYEYDSSSRIVGIIDAIGSRTSITYDGVSRRTRLEDPNAGTFDYAYDGEGRLTRETGPDGGETFFRYSPTGQLLEKELPDGRLQVFRYGTAGDVNAVGRLVEVFDAAGVLQLSYDARGRVVERRRLVGDKTYVMGWTYDSMDRVRSITYPDGFEVHHEYDPGNNLTSLVDQNGDVIIDQFVYSAGGRIEGMRYGNGVTTEMTYDVLERMETNSAVNSFGHTIQALTYAFDSANNVTSLHDAIREETRSFEYDELGRLTRATSDKNEVDRRYEFDAIGNLTRKGDLRFAMDSAHPQRVICAAEIGGKRGPEKKIDDCSAGMAGLAPDEIKRAFAMAYDERGNMTVKGSRRFEYDGANRLRTVSDQRGRRERVLERNTYDAAGNLVIQENGRKRRVIIGGWYEETRSRATRNIFAGSLAVAIVTSGSKRVELIRSALPDRGLPIYRAGFSSTGILLLLTVLLLDRRRNWGIYSSIKEIGTRARSNPTHLIVVLAVAMSPLAQPSTAHAVANPGLRLKSLYLHGNHLGSVTAVTNEKGRIRQTREYEPFGSAENWKGGLHSGRRTIGPAFQGQEFDPATDLYNFNARHYDPEIGRFTNADTIVSDVSDPRTLNRYAFAVGNPIRYTDPTGRSIFSAIGDAFASAGEWLADNIVEILTVVAIVLVVVLVAAAIVLTGGLAAVLAGAGGFAALGSFAAAGAAIGFATFGGIALSQGYGVDSAEFWIAASSGAVLGGLVGAALPLAFAPGAVFAGGITSLAGQMAAGFVVGAAAGGLEAAIACSTGCGSVDQLWGPVLQGVVIGGLIGAAMGGVFHKLSAFIKPASGTGYWARAGNWVRNLPISYWQPAKVGFSVKTLYATGSAAAGRRGGTLYGDGLGVAGDVVAGDNIGDQFAHDDESGGTWLGLTTSSASP
ncbi:MAG: FG-GAP-like repeat-containing protein [Candidatus Binatia bacterium]|nr:FG-GAP-like repeat-containing protein [Candidatus Binatia bacterium]